MKQTICTAVLLAVVAAVLIGTGPASGQAASPGQQYSITDLGTLGGDFSENPDINDRGQVVSTSRPASGEAHAFLWENGEMTDLGTLPGGLSSAATAINDRGQVVGWGSSASGEFHTVLWTK